MNMWSKKVIGEDKVLISSRRSNPGYLIPTFISSFKFNLIGSYIGPISIGNCECTHSCLVSKRKFSTFSKIIRKPTFLFQVFRKIDKVLVTKLFFIFGNCHEAFLRMIPYAPSPAVEFNIECGVFGVFHCSYIFRCLFGQGNSVVSCIKTIGHDDELFRNVFQLSHTMKIHFIIRIEILFDAV